MQQHLLLKLQRLSFHLLAPPYLELCLEKQLDMIKNTITGRSREWYLLQSINYSTELIKDNTILLDY
jgi:hypothetical protein